MRLNGALLCLALVLGAAGAVAAPTDVAGFTALLADKFADANPDAKVEVKGPLELEITIGKGPHQTLLRNVWGLCQRVPERCDLAIDDFVGHYSGAMREEDGPVTRADLRAVVRTEGYVEELRQVAANKPDAAVIARKLAGDLWLICVVDRADGVELLNMGTIAKLHLSADDAISTALDNVEQSLPPMAKQKTKLLHGKITVISGDFYNSSRILLHDSWRRIAKRMHGDLIVAVPGTDLLVYGKSETAEDTQALRTVVALIAQQAHRQISLTLLRWTETGWDVVAP